MQRNEIFDHNYDRARDVKDEGDFHAENARRVGEAQEANEASRISQSLQVNHNPNKGALPTSRLSDDNNSQNINTLGKKKGFNFGSGTSYNNVGLVQVARANYNLELNKFNTRFEAPGIEKPQQPVEDKKPVLGEFVQTQTGRNMVADKDDEDEEAESIPHVQAPARTFTTARGRVVRI